MKSQKNHHKEQHQLAHAQVEEDIHIQANSYQPKHSPDGKQENVFLQEMLLQEQQYLFNQESVYQGRQPQQPQHGHQDGLQYENQYEQNHQHGLE